MWLLYVGLIWVEYVLWIVVGDFIGLVRICLVLMLLDLDVLCLYLDIVVVEGFVELCLV